MNEPFFSVIVPQHNSAAYMRKGLDSIKEQTFKDYELIIVCDACENGEADIAREYTDKVYSINARSAGVARNVGLGVAKGKWILWMDDDDWFLHDYAFEMLAERLKNTSADVLCFSFIYKGQGYAKCALWIAVWNKAWRRSFVESKPYRFPPKTFADDVDFAEETHPKAKVEYWDMPLYYYNFMREGSIAWRTAQGEFDEK